MEKVEPVSVAGASARPLSRLTPRAAAWLWMVLLAAAYFAGIALLNHGLSLDRALEEIFFTRPCVAADVHGCWTFNKDSDFSTFILHTVPEKFFVILGALAALVFLGGFARPGLKRWRDVSLAALIGIAGVSGGVGLLKSATGHYCPSQLAEYGGAVTHVPFAGIKARCFPAGHPAPGFGLLVFCFSNLSRGWRRFGLYAGLGAGGGLSLVQFARGEHFLSHALATLLTALFAGCCLYFYNCRRKAGGDAAADR